MFAPKLVVAAGPDQGVTFALRVGADHLLGRSADAAYVLSDSRASRQHCEVRVRGEQVTVRDRGSRSGTFVNGSRIDEAVLAPGDVIQVGETKLRYEAVPANEAETLMPVPAPAFATVEQLAGLAGQPFGRFTLGPVLGVGTTSVVFRATGWRGPVALKVMLPAVTVEVERFVRAMHTVLPHRHPNLVTQHEAGKANGLCWVAMELIEGESLTRVIARIGVAGMLDWKRAFRATLQVARALEYAHAHGVVHRNVTPSNILERASDKVVKLGDLMLAKATEGALAQPLTKPGELLGNVDYMSPERVAGGGQPLDGRSDLFGLGATCYALLTGRPPFAGNDLLDTLTRIRTAQPVPPGHFQIGLPAAFEGAVMKLLAKRPEDRFPTAGELVHELERIGRFSGVSV